MEIIALERPIIFDIFSIGWWVIAFIFLLKNIIIDKRPVFTLLVNILVIFVTFIPCAIDFVTLDEWVSATPNTFSVLFVFSAIIVISIMITLKNKYEMKVNDYFICTIVLGIVLVLSKVLCTQWDMNDLIPKEEYIKDSFEYYINSLKILLIQTNLFISFMNANWDCFKKKVGKF